jgi:hypothetical protein
MLRHPNAFIFDNRAGLSEHFAGTIMKNFETDVLHDVKSGPLNFQYLIITQDPQTYGSLLNRTRIHHNAPRFPSG